MKLKCLTRDLNSFIDSARFVKEDGTVPKIKTTSDKIFYKFMNTIVAFFIIFTSIFTYTYGMLYYVPTLIATFPTALKTFLYVLFTWILFGINVNIYLVRKRNSYVRNRNNLHPPPKEELLSKRKKDFTTRSKQSHEHQEFPHDGEMEGKNMEPDKAFNEVDPDDWHFCSDCDQVVPPRSWHCHACRTCVLRRDHHCRMTGTCIGEENHSNFLGLLFYLCTGGFFSAVVCIINALYFENMPLWRFLIQTVMLIPIDLDPRIVIGALIILGQAVAWPYFVLYLNYALRKQTAADIHRNVLRVQLGSPEVSYQNLQEFLGPCPILRLLWPFHPPFKTNYRPIDSKTKEFEAERSRQVKSE